MAQPKSKRALKRSTEPIASQTELALLDAARAIFETEGVAGISVRRVAESAGCTTMAVYSRFGGKDGILGALFDEGFEKLASAQRAVNPALKNAARLSALCRAYRTTAHSYPHHYALMLGHFSGALVPSQASQLKALVTLDFLTDAVGALSSMKGKSRALSSEIATRLFAFCHGWVSLERMQFFSNPKQADAAFDRAVSALIAEKPSRKSARPTPS